MLRNDRPNNNLVRIHFPNETHIIKNFLIIYFLLYIETFNLYPCYTIYKQEKYVLLLDNMRAKVKRMTI